MKEAYIAAVEIGSSKITGAVGLSLPDGTLQVVAVEQESSRDYVRYGIIHNPEEVGSRVMRIVERLNNNPAVAPRVITGVYVGLSGRSMRSIPSEVKLHFSEETEITGDILERLRTDASAILLDKNYDILSIVPRQYQIDGLETTSPRGAMGKSIAATFDIIVGRNELKRNIERALATDRTGLQLRGLVVTQLAAADIVLTNEEKRLGAMLVDFGAETTSVSIYRKGELCYYATLPLGGRNITRDLTTLSILEEKAEEIKKESGRAVAPENPSTLNIYGIKLSDVSNHVVARAEEIVANVIQQIAYAGLKEKDLPGGIVCIGAGARLNGLLELLETQSSLNARMGKPLDFIHPLDQKSKRHDTIQTTAILYGGARMDAGECLEMPAPDENYEIDDDNDDDKSAEIEEKPSKMGRFFGRFAKIFAPSDEDSELE